MKNLSILTAGLAAGVLAVLGLALIPPLARAEMAPAGPPMETTSQGGLAQFDLIVQRNIFDPNRGMAQPSPVITARHQAVVETFSFRGAAEKLGKGTDGFFVGDGVPGTGIIDVNDRINGFKVLEINLHEAKLQGANDEVVILTDQTGLTRQDQRPWMKIAVPTPYTVTTATRVAPETDSPQPSSRPSNITNPNNGRRNRNGGRYNYQGGAPTSQDDPAQAPAPIAQAGGFAQPSPED